MGKQADGVRAAGTALLALAWLAALVGSGFLAYDIRMYAINTYGRVIHEFDPWFNYRATEYLGEKVVWNGWYQGLLDFFHWYDYKSWYPLGRPVGTTIYPGMQITSVWIWRVLGWAPESWGVGMSLNDVCCFVPVWFGVSCTVLLAMLTGECTKSWSTGAAAAGIMSVIPAHVMRCHGGGYDNESIALTALCCTFFCWCRALRDDPDVTDGSATRDSIRWGALSGFAYIYMVAAWGGYIFVINMVALHAGALCVLGRYSSKLHRAYSLFYVIGTIGAVQIPVVGWSPLTSLEQLAGLAAFLGLQFLEFCEIRRRRDNLDIFQTFLLRVKIAIPFFAVVCLGAWLLYVSGNMSPLGARIRGLFVKHTRTGNPLVDSVAEHQPADESAYKQYLGVAYDLGPYGLALCVLHWSDASFFLVMYTLAAYYFSNKMARLIVLGGPIASALAGVAIGTALDQLIVNAAGSLMMRILASTDPETVGELAAAEGDDGEEEEDDEDEDEDENESSEEPSDKNLVRKNGKWVSGDVDDGSPAPAGRKSPTEKLTHLKVEMKKSVLSVYDHPLICLIRIGIGAYLCKEVFYPQSVDFYNYGHQLADGLSQPSIMFRANLQNGQEIIVDDYREAYHWLRDKTPEDSRVMAWWDYGYQITGIGNRTTIADGNTWNHEHIATLGRILSSPEKRAHAIAKHLADYVLVWAGGGGDDLAKSPHMARIGNSVYGDICPGDPTCSQFGFYHGGRPTKMMEECLLYKMCLSGQHGVKPLNASLFREVFSSKYGKVKIFKVVKPSKKSKAWVADPANRVCDAEGSWYCTGQYPPPLKPLIDKRKNFAQLEDFNKKKTKEDEEYTKEYMKRMEGGGAAPPEEAEAAAAAQELNLNYIGCYASEDQLGSDKEYGGGVHGANMALAVQFARDQRKRYLAIARVGVDGHNFAFSEAPSGDAVSDSACDAPCADGGSYKCGCADAACGGAAPAPGEELVRRWVVYELPKRSKGDAAKEAIRKKKKKKGKQDL